MSPDSFQPPPPCMTMEPPIVKLPDAAILGSTVGRVIVTPTMVVDAQATLTIPKKKRIVKTIKAIRLFFFSDIRSP